MLHAKLDYPVDIYLHGKNSKQIVEFNIDYCVQVRGLFPLRVLCAVCDLSRVYVEFYLGVDFLLCGLLSELSISHLKLSFVNGL